MRTFTRHAPAIESKATSASKSFFFQPKLTINQPNDIYEQEADAMADRVMRTSATNEHSFFKPALVSAIQRKCDECEKETFSAQASAHKEEKLQLKESSAQTPEISSDVSSYIDSLSYKGSPLSVETRNFFEPRFENDFSHVRIHTDAQANESAQHIHALAYTTGSNIVFNQNQFSPETETGKKLLAHELTHVVQQKGSSFFPAKLQRCVGADVPKFDSLVSDIRKHAVYKGLDAYHKTLTEEIITKAKTKDDCLIYIAKLLLLFNTPTRAQADIAATATVEANAAVGSAKTRLSDAKEREQSVLEEQKSYRHRKSLKKVKGRNDIYYYVDNTDPNNIVVRINVHLTGDQVEIDKVKSLEDDIEKEGSTKGYVVDLVFVSYTGPDVFTVTTNPGGWTDAGNFRAGDPLGLAHEMHHLFGLPDRYDYLAHADNPDMLLNDRIYWFRQGMDIDPKDIDPNSIMGGGFKPTNKDICAVAQLDDKTCEAARAKAGN